MTLTSLQSICYTFLQSKPATNCTTPKELVVCLDEIAKDTVKLVLELSEYVPIESKAILDGLNNLQSAFESLSPIAGTQLSLCQSVILLFQELISEESINEANYETFFRYLKRVQKNLQHISQMLMPLTQSVSPKEGATNKFSE